MFARLAAVSTLAFAFAVAAAAATGGVCNTGALKCCNSLEDPQSAVGSVILGALGLDVQDVVAQVGVGCTPITVVGAGGAESCSAKPACCTDNSQGGAVSLGCVPVSL